MSLKFRALIALSIGLALGLTLTLGSKLSGHHAAARTSGFADARLLAEVMQSVRREYVDVVDDSQLLESAIRGMVSDLDPHSQFLDEAEFSDIRESATGNYYGVGLEVILDGHDVRVIAPFDGSPAQRAGVKAQDIIIAIDDTPVDGDELFSTVSRMRGAAGTPVRLSIMRTPDEAPLEFTLLRERVRIVSVTQKLLAPGLGYVRISQFHDDTAIELADAIGHLVSENLTPLTSLVLDLRDNPGGLLDSAIDVADLFLSEGMIVSARGRTEDAKFEYHARKGDITESARMVVLVNGASASAAEIVAGALRDNERARLVGTSTFGKGLVQTVMPLSHGQAIKLTTSRYYTPSGDYIQNKGLTPDVVVREGDDENTDMQLRHAREILQSTRLVLKSEQ